MKYNRIEEYLTSKEHLMKVLGISGSPRKGSTTDQLVQEVLAGVEGCETQFVSLAGKTIGPCIACLKCVETNVCVLTDDLADLRVVRVLALVAHVEEHVEVNLSHRPLAEGVLDPASLGAVEQGRVAARERTTK